MTGGLLQIVTYGSQDLFLTGTPEITFFKVVYRRYTNFSIESVKVPFDDIVGFGVESSLIVPRSGDLIHKSYLEITIPSISIPRTPPNVNYTSKLTTAQTNYSYAKSFMSVNTSAYRNGYNIFISENSTTEDMLNSISDAYNVENFNDTIMPNFLTAIDDSGLSTPYSLISIQEIIKQFYDNNLVISTVTKTNIMNALNKALERSKKSLKYFLTKITECETQIDTDTNPHALFAWIEKLGHHIIDFVTVQIGGDFIDKHYGHYLDVWHELSGFYQKETIYNKMIGHISDIYTPTRTKKGYTMYVPLEFWFCKYNGLAIPLVSLGYHDVTFIVKFKKFNQCSYIGEAEDNTMEIPELNEYLENEGKDLEASILIDYVFLDDLERKKFAQSKHEYLIEQVQVLEINEIKQPETQILFDFNYPCKEVIWTAQRESTLDNITGYNKPKYSDYSLDVGVFVNKKIGITTQSVFVSNVINPIIFSQMEFNGTVRFPKLSYQYFNYVQPYAHHCKTPTDGINVYSFALHPEEHQPSGTCNMSRIDKINLNITLHENMFLNDDSVTVFVYTINYNILRFASGMAGLAFVLGS